MKKIISILIVAAFFTNTQAQLATQLTVQARPTAIISSWANSPQVITFLVNNLGQSTISFKIKTTIKTTEGEIVAISDVTKVQTFTVFATGNLLLNANAVVPFEFMQFNGKYNNILQRTGKLPSGTYQIFTQLLTPQDLAPLTQEQFKIFNIATLQLPFLVSPAPGITLDKNIAQTAITFRWTPLVPSQEYASYNIQVFEVLENQKPMQAFRTNMPVLDRKVVGTTQFIWQPQLSMLDEVLQEDTTSVVDAIANLKTEKIRTFIWTVQTSTSDQFGKETIVSEGSINGDGRSQPEIFYISKKTANK
jgi:hypothetical protein